MRKKRKILRKKKLDLVKILYKVNEGVVSSEDEDDIGDISKVSPSSVLSLVVFLTLLKDKDVFDVKAVPYLPLRYLSRDIVANEQSLESREKLLERNERIQRNVTDKFIRTFMRVAHHMDDCEVTMFPYEYDEFLHFRLGNSFSTNNSLLNVAVVSMEHGGNLKI